LIIAAVLLSMVVVALPVSAGPIDTYINGPWLEFGFGGVNTDAYSCPGCGSSSGDNSVFLDDPAWTFTLNAPTQVKITDAFFRGDSFRMYDFGSLVLTTLSVPQVGISCGSDPEGCYGAEGVSYGSFILASGVHSLTVQMADSPYGSGAAYFRIDRIVAAPEPLSIMLLGVGLLGLGAIKRSRG
jgi:hypothetical protein